MIGSRKPRYEYGLSIYCKPAIKKGSFIPSNDSKGTDWNFGGGFHNSLFSVAIVMSNLWIDDERNPPDGWIWVKTALDAIKAIRTC